MKKMRSVWLSILLCLALAITSGCGGKGAGSQGSQLSESNQLREDGVVTKEEMASIAGQEKTITFSGETPEGIAYVWNYPAKNIKNPQEQRLKVACATAGLESIQEKAASLLGQQKGELYALGVTLEKFYLAADARLSLTLTEKWDTDGVALYKDTDKGLQELAKAECSETGGKTVLTFQVSEAGNTFYLLGKKAAASEGSKADSQTESKTESSGNTGNESQGENKADSQSGGTAAATGNSQGTPSSGSAPGFSGSSGQPAGTGTSQSGGTGTSQPTDTGSAGSAGTSSAPTAETPKAPAAESPAPTGNTCTISIECSTILANMGDLDPAKAPYVPADGWILRPVTVEFSPGETVFDVLARVCGQYGIHMESSYTPAYGSRYIEGINQLYEFDCGSTSGWMYRVNGWYPNYGCSSYKLENGDVIEWKYTCTLGSDVGGGF